MPRRLLTERMVKQAKPGVLIDGGGLRLKITVNPVTGARRKSWILRVTVKGGGVRELGLGSAEDFSLKEARDRAVALRKLARDGIDPLAARQMERAARATEVARTMSFRKCAEGYIDAHRPGWRNAKHADQWSNTLESYVYPKFGDLPVQAIDVALVMKAIEPIWSTKTETASRVRQRIEAVLDWASARGFRSGENPARWRGHLDKLLPARARVQKVEHHAAMPYADAPQFLAMLGERDGLPGKALRFLILTAARSSEVLNARWREIDIAKRAWLVPAERMKAGRAHRVPLSNAAMAVLEGLDSNREPDAYVFPGARENRPISNAVFLKVLARHGFADLTAHGFRSTFRDWAAEQTNFPREVAEAALAHVVSDKVEAAYRRGDLFEKRRQMMDAWGRYCANARAPEGPKVLSIRKRA